MLTYNIALFSSFNFHLECIGFICELFTSNIYLSDKYNITIYYNEDNFNNIPFYKSIYKNIIMEKHYSKIFNEINNYVLIIKLSSNDLQLNHPNVISILHRIDLTDQVSKYITLSPLVNITEPINPYNYNINLPKSKFNYIFPLYFPITTRTYENIITYIGYFVNSHYDDDLKNFINNSPNYTFYFLNNQNINPFISHKNVFVINAIDSEGLATIVKKSKFILIRKLPHQSKELFTGGLSISLSFKKPIILQNYFIKIYNLPAIGFNDNYSELIDLINNFPDTIYQQYLNLIDNYTKIINEHNKKKIASLIKR